MAAEQNKGRLVNLALLAVSLVLSGVGGLLVLQAYARVIGATDLPHYVADPKPRLWRRDAVTGYSNAPNLELHAFGNIVGRTNARGFRRDTEVALSPPSGRLRVFAMGDSVMWGMRTNLDGSISGALEALYAADGLDAEVVNAGIIGFSTLQEFLLLKSQILPFAPDVVLVNFNSNDWYPTDDPFETAEAVYRAYFDSLRTGYSGLDVTPVRAVARELSWGNLDWDRRRALAADPDKRDALVRILFEIPMERMAELARASGFRLVYLFVPDANAKRKTRLARHLEAHLQGLGVETLGFVKSLREPAPKDLDSGESGESTGGQVVESSRLQGVLAGLGLGVLDPLPVFRRIAEVKGFRELETSRMYIDEGHPSRRGNAIIAGEVYELLRRPLGAEIRAPAPQ